MFKKYLNNVSADNDWKLMTKFFTSHHEFNTLSFEYDLKRYFTVKQTKLTTIQVEEESKKNEENDKEEKDEEPKIKKYKQKLEKEVKFRKIEYKEFLNDFSYQINTFPYEF